TDTSDSNADQVTVIPASMLKIGEVIRHESLPFDMEVLEYTKNTDLVDVRPGNKRTDDVFAALDGQRFAIVPRGEEKAVDPNGRDDAAAVRVRLFTKDTDHPLGTHLLSLWFSPNYVSRAILF